MSTITALDLPRSTRIDRCCLAGSTLLTYGVGYWIVTSNPFMQGMFDRPPIYWSAPSTVANALVSILLLIVGYSPRECLMRIVIIASVIQLINCASAHDDDIDVDKYRPYVFWRAIARFLRSCLPYLRSRDLDGPPHTSLTEYERITVRYFFVKLIFMPMMISGFFGNLQCVLWTAWRFPAFSHMTPVEVEHLYLIGFNLLMMVDVAWFAIGCSVETGTYSPIKMVDPYASGWIVALACYPPLVGLAGRYFVWAAPIYPVLDHLTSAWIYSAIGITLFTFYVVADLSFGLKTGNLTYRGLVDKGPYQLIRHPMYASKTLAWVIFTIPGLNIHVDHMTVGLLTIPTLSVNWAIVWPMLAWVCIYATRAFTEERYLLTFPEYQAYCRRVRFRFIPGLL